MRIRSILDTDIAAVAALMRALSDEFIVHESSAEAGARFHRENDANAILAFFRAGTAYYVAEIDGAIAGFIAIRDNKHIFHMFVDKAHHRQGIARELWAAARQAALEAGNPGEFTVNASNYALSAYEAMGFVRMAPTQYKNGIYYNPMKLGGVTP